MITFDADGARFNYRIAAIIRHDERVLLCREEGQDFWFMPGGRAELLEPSTETVVREIREELGVEARIERLVWVVENFFPWVEGVQAHEVSLFYLLALPHDSSLLDRGAPFRGIEGDVTLIFAWHWLDTLEHVLLHPKFLRTTLQRIPDTIEHIVNVDDEEI
jgi:ADP-ribose pyrophosphatase YjhB (NUDIX family)